MPGIPSSLLEWLSELTVAGQVARASEGSITSLLTISTLQALSLPCTASRFPARPASGRLFPCRHPSSGQRGTSDI